MIIAPKTILFHPGCSEEQLQCSNWTARSWTDPPLQRNDACEVKTSYQKSLLN